MKHKKPDWLKVRAVGQKEANEIEQMLTRLSLHTVCEEARCPNIMECFNRRTAAFMILGNKCTSMTLRNKNISGIFRFAIA